MVKERPDYPDNFADNVSISNTLVDLERVVYRTISQEDNYL